MRSTSRIPSPKEGRPKAVGISIINALREYLENYQKEHPDQLEIRTGTTVVGLVTWNDYVTGVRYENKEQKIGKKRTVLLPVYSPISRRARRKGGRPSDWRLLGRPYQRLVVAGGVRKG